MILVSCQVLEISSTNIYLMNVMEQRWHIACGDQITKNYI